MFPVDYSCKPPVLNQDIMLVQIGVREAYAMTLLKDRLCEGPKSGDSILEYEGDLIEDCVLEGELRIEAAKLVRCDRTANRAKRTIMES